jgi:hypothetical protein
MTGMIWMFLAGWGFGWWFFKRPASVENAAINVWTWVKGLFG